MKTSTWLLAALAATCSAWVGAQTPATVTATDPAPQAAQAPVAAGDCCRVAAGTPVELEIADLLSSANRKRGDRFTLRLHAPLLHGGKVVVPAGTAGVGEVVHGERSRGGGKPGELLLAARYLEIDGVQIPLRGLKLGGQGQDKSHVALATSLAVGPFAHFIHGKEIEIPSGTLATAKLAQDLALPLAAPDATQTSSAAASTPDATTTQE